MFNAGARTFRFSSFGPLSVIAQSQPLASGMTPMNAKLRLGPFNNALNTPSVGYMSKHINTCGESPELSGKFRECPRGPKLHSGHFDRTYVRQTGFLPIRHTLSPLLSRPSKENARPSFFTFVVGREPRSWYPNCHGSLSELRVLGHGTV